MCNDDIIAKYSKNIIVNVPQLIYSSGKLEELPRNPRENMWFHDVINDKWYFYDIKKCIWEKKYLVTWPGIPIYVTNNN